MIQFADNGIETTLVQQKLAQAPVLRRRRMRAIDFASKRVHMIGIGGCGMRAAADVLLRSGAVVTGSDRDAFAGVDPLIQAGATVRIGQRASNVPAELDLVVISAAIPESNEELQEARRLGCRVIFYAELLGELMALRKGVAVAGTHGKSTTTALATHLFRTAGLDPTFVIGAEAPQLSGASGVGLGEHFLAEACEFNRSFLNLRPQSAAILNIEADHLDCFRDLDEIIQAFTEFAGNVDESGLIVASHDDRNVAEAVQSAPARVETFGLDERATWRAASLAIDRGRYTFDVTYEGLKLFRTSLAIAGRHNVTNALAAAALAWNAGAGRDEIADGLRTFEGVNRRMSLRGEFGGIIVVDDYAHHPTEIRVTLAAVRDQFVPNRVWVVFQPHQHSRTRILMDEFADSFDLADEIIIPDIYGSRDTETEIKRTGAHMLVTRIQACGGNVRYVPKLEDIAAILQRELQAGDLLITMGAGDVWKLTDEMVERLNHAN